MPTSMASMLALRNAIRPMPTNTRLMPASSRTARCTLLMRLSSPESPLLPRRRRTRLGGRRLGRRLAALGLLKLLLVFRLRLLEARGGVDQGLLLLVARAILPRHLGLARSALLGQLV